MRSSTTGMVVEVTRSMFGGVVVTMTFSETAPTLRVKLTSCSAPTFNWMSCVTSSVNPAAVIETV